MMGQVRAVVVFAVAPDRCQIGNGLVLVRIFDDA